MKVLVTGGSGFIGTHLIEQFQKDGVDYVTIGRRFPSDQRNIRFDLLSSADLTGQLEKLKPTHLIHLGWYAEHGKYWESALNIDWLVATNRLVEAFCQSGGKHVLIAGTCAEYDWRHGFCIEDLTPLRPSTLYGIAKKSAHDLSSHVCEKYGVKFAWARIFFPYGRGESKERLIPALFDVFRNAKPAFGVNASVYRDLLHVSDVADAMSLCSRKEAQGAINICSGHPVLLGDVVRAVAKLCLKSPDSVLSIDSSRGGEPDFLVGDNKKLKNLGWMQKLHWVDGIQTYQTTGTTGTT